MHKVFFVRSPLAQPFSATSSAAFHSAVSIFLFVNSIHYHFFLFDIGFCGKVFPCANYLSAFHKSVLEHDYRNKGVQGRRKQHIVLCFLLDIDGAATRGASAYLFESTGDSDWGLQLTMHNHLLSCNDILDFDAICRACIADKMKSSSYPYGLFTNQKISESLWDIFTVEVYAWDSRRMLDGHCQVQTPRSPLLEGPSHSMLPSSPSTRVPGHACRFSLSPQKYFKCWTSEFWLIIS